MLKLLETLRHLKLRVCPACSLDRNAGLRRVISHHHQQHTLRLFQNTIAWLLPQDLKRRTWIFINKLPVTLPFAISKDISIVFSAGESGSVKLGVLFPEFPLSVLLGMMIVGLGYLQVLGQHSSHYKAEFRNSRSSARFRSLCKAQKQAQWFSRLLLRGP